MTESQSGIKKLYYSIGEVSALVDLKQYVLRYWETEFSMLRPQKNRAGNRKYRKKDIDLVVKIKNLLYNQKYTIAGAREILRGEQRGDIETKSDINSNDYKKLLSSIKIELQEILELLSRH
ncbi:MAG TPA: MerR family transcriptional regulator [Gammaproteobacteria bacterium]|nr:MerR family transcriptional regulator [Gammaproteobacteria bacterium]